MRGRKLNSELEHRAQLATGPVRSAKPFTSPYKCTSSLHARASPLARVPPASMSYYHQPLWSEAVPLAPEGDDDAHYGPYDAIQPVSIVQDAYPYQTVRISSHYISQTRC